MKIAITGATGLIGSALTSPLRVDGHQVLPISRSALPGGIRWNPDRDELDPASLEGCDALINLAGANIAAGRWTPGRRRLLTGSRVRSTDLLARTAARLSRPPAVILSASAIGIYGDAGERELDEGSLPADDFLGHLARTWESALDPARDAGIRVVTLRMGVVLTPAGGALAKMLPFFRLGLGGPLGNGRQWMSWVSLPDVVAACRFLLERHDIGGPVNVTTPHPIRSRDFAKALARSLHRPALLPVPRFALRLIVGRMAEETVLASQRVRPDRLIAAGFRFGYPDLESALAAILRSTHHRAGQP